MTTSKESTTILGVGGEEARAIARGIVAKYAGRYGDPLLVGGTVSMWEGEITAAILSVESRARREGMEEMRERAAAVIDAGQETHSSENEGYFLTPRKPGNSAGLVYASAIRSLPTLPERG